MKYYLTKDQWTYLWTQKEYSNWNHHEMAYNIELIEYYNRIGIFDNVFKNKYKLTYTEYPIEDTDNDDEPLKFTTVEGYYGILTGDEKNITWFILNEL